jgi:DNA-binding beta-propeller fold protein YncE
MNVCARMRTSRQIALAAALLLWTAQARASERGFAQPPLVAQAGEKTTIAFVVTATTDVEVTILDAKGEPVRHLAAGVLGGRKPPPEPLQTGLSQKLEWDGRDDGGQPARGGPFQIRVRAGMGVTYGRSLTDSPYFIGSVQGLAGDADGNLYVFHQTLGSGPQSVQVFDDRGQYLRTAFPFAANLPREKLGDLIYWSAEEGRVIPRNYHDTYPRQIPYFFKAGESIQMLPAVTRTGGILIFAPQWLFRLDLDGATGGRPLRFGRFFPVGLSPYDAMGGAIFATASPDGRTLYAAGPYSKVDAAGNPYNERWPAGQIFSMPLGADEYLKPFARLEQPAKGASLATPPVAGLATDGRGQVYVCDRANARIAVLDARGKPAGAIPVAVPFRVAVHSGNGSIYVLAREDLTREEMTRKGKVVRRTYRYRLSRFEGPQAAQPAAAVDLGESACPNGWLALTVKDGRTGIWLAALKHGEERLDRGDVTRYEEKNGTFEPTVLLAERDPDALGAHDTLAVDPATEEVYINDDYSGMYRYHGLTGAGGSLRKVRNDFYSTDLAVGRDSLLYVRSGSSYSGPLERLTRELKPAPLESGSHLYTDYIFSRWGSGYAEKGVAVGPQGQVYVMNMFDWQRYAVYGLSPKGAFLDGAFLKGKLAAYAGQKGPRPSSAVIGPLPDSCGGLRVDSRGNIYAGLLMLPPGYPVPPALRDDPSWGALVGSIAKFGPEGGEWICTDPRLAARAGSNVHRTVPEGAKGIQMERGHFLRGALDVFPGFAPFSGSAGTGETGRPPMGRENCACRSPRFDIDRFDRLYIPNAVTGRVRVLDNAGNEILAFGEYGNRDSDGPGSAIPVPAIPLAWPIGVGVSRERIYVCDQLNRRVVRVDKTWAEERVLNQDGKPVPAAAPREPAPALAAPAVPMPPAEPPATAAPAGVVPGSALLPRARAPLLDGAPALDGNLNDEFWKKAAKLAEFRPNTGGPNRAGPRTEALVACTRDALYLGFRCQEKDLAGLLGKAQESSWEDDGLEIYLQAGSNPTEPYHHIRVNALGALQAEYHRAELSDGKKFQAAAGREPEAWTLELALPFSSLTLPQDEKTLAGSWRFNIVRLRPLHKGDTKPGGAVKLTRQGEPYNEETAWAPTECESGHMPHMFGFLAVEAFGK